MSIMLSGIPAIIPDVTTMGKETTQQTSTIKTSTLEAQTTSGPQTTETISTQPPPTTPLQPISTSGLSPLLSLLWAFHEATKYMMGNSRQHLDNEKKLNRCGHNIVSLVNFRLSPLLSLLWAFHEATKYMMGNCRQHLDNEKKTKSLWAQHCVAR